MAMSQSTKFSLNNGKEEIEISFDMKNGELQFSRVKLPETEGVQSPTTKNTFTIRIQDLDPVAWIELSQTMNFGFEKLFLTDGYGDQLEYLNEEYNTTYLLGDDEEEDD